MEIRYSATALQDIEYWKKSGNVIIQKKVQQLIEAIVENPYYGIGKPEPLKQQMTGLWSRRITKEHRLIYKPVPHEAIIMIYSVKGHYN